jgi:hypothetical protein
LPNPSHSSKRTDDRARIRALFRHPRPWYGVGDAAAALRMEPGRVLEAIEDGSIEAVVFEGELRIHWEEVVTLGVLQRWTPRIVSTALPPRQVPPLARSVRKAIELPRYLWELLALFAAQRAITEAREITVSDVLEEVVHHSLHGQVHSWHLLEERIPGIRTAAVWPLVWDVDS